MSDQVAERDALYYPYVHFPSDDWLKSALLFSPHVCRMVAPQYEPRHDTEFVRKLRTVNVNGIPLLEHAELYSETAQKAQRVLLQKLRADIEREGDAFRLRFNKAAARAVATDKYGFQVHPGKLVDDSILELEREGLAWVPDHPDDAPYRELHPAIGSAFLGSVAVACAADQGLAVVGNGQDVACRRLNQLTANCDFAAVYSEFVHGMKPARKPRGGTGDAIADIILFKHCDASKLEAKDFEDLGKEREPIRKLKARLQEFASQIPPMLNDEGLERKLKECAVAALEDWQKDRPSFRGAMKKFFGADLAKAAAGLAKGSIGKFADVASTGNSVGLGASAGAIALNFLGPIGGFGVGLVVHAVSTAIGEITRERNSAYRYLSMAEKAGVIFSIGGKQATEPPAGADGKKT